MRENSTDMPLKSDLSPVIIAVQTYSFGCVDSLKDGKQRLVNGTLIKFLKVFDFKYFKFPHSLRIYQQEGFTVLFPTDSYYWELRLTLKTCLGYEYRTGT